jgi:membrane-bound metal-dependent hydrolase YbcI (DUF457 family)
MGAQAVQLGVARLLSTRERLLLGGAAAAFPDIDFIGFLVDPLRFLAHWHQGPTHSLILLPLWAALLGALFCMLSAPLRSLPPGAAAGFGGPAPADATLARVRRSNARQRDRCRRIRSI